MNGIAAWPSAANVAVAASCPSSNKETLPAWEGRPVTWTVARLPLEPFSGVTDTIWVVVVARAAPAALTVIAAAGVTLPA